MPVAGGKVIILSEDVKDMAIVAVAGLAGGFVIGVLIALWAFNSLF